MQANRDCAFCMDEREDRPPHPYMNLAVLFDGTDSTDIHRLFEQAEYLRDEIQKLGDGGGTICSRDGRHISYVPGSYDPWPLKEIT